MKTQLLPPFPNYLQLREHSHIPEWLWHVTRIIAICAIFVLSGTLIWLPDIGLLIFWKLLVPILPLIFLTVPGLWRNICPLAAFNQIPRRANLGWALTPPAWWRDYGYVIGMISFFVLASSRKWLFSKSGPASGILLLAALLTALLGGFIFKGKSGWCSSICPLYPVQRLYNQTPFKIVPNQYCTPCVGCTKNCYDFNPETAYLDDLHDSDRHYTNIRKFFAAAMPGFILAFFLLPDVPTISALTLYTQTGLYMMVSVALFTVMDTFLKVTPNKITAVWGAAAISLFYWFVLPAWANAVAGLLGVGLPTWLIWAGRSHVILLALVWINRTYRKERDYAMEKGIGKQTAVSIPKSPNTMSNTTSGEITVTFGETAVSATADQSLLEIAEDNNQPIEAGCRMGLCGADPITVVAGMENLSAMGQDERSTLQRMGAGDNVRLACMCRAKGAVTVSSGAEQGSGVLPPQEPVEYDKSVKQVVIIGNGIAGVTAADTVRRYHPDCAIHLIGREKHPLYNRMAISRLIYDRSAMSGLYLHSDTWYDERQITSWLNTQVTEINKDSRGVILPTGETLPYDRLILACGSSSYLPPLPGLDLPGSFVLREADEAMEIRAYVQTHGCQHAVIAGGGLLGLEAGYALLKLGLHVTILERGPWLLRRQLDESSSRLLQQHLEQLGMQILLEAEVVSLGGEEHVERVWLSADCCLPCDIFLTAVGIRPNTELAAALGLVVKRGVVVSNEMETSEAGVYAVGDMCEFNNELPGLWAIAAEQARVAAINAVGGQATYQSVVPATTLKVVGVDVTSIGRFNAEQPGEQEIVLEDEAIQRYRKLVIANGRIVGAILLGYASEAATITTAIKQGWDVTDFLPDIQAGQWDTLHHRLTHEAVC